MVEAHATVLHRMGMLLRNHVARRSIAVSRLDLEGFFIHKTVTGFEYWISSSGYVLVVYVLTWCV